MTSHTELEHLLVHTDWLTRLARRLVADAATADDLVQDTWVAAMRRPPDPNRPARPWLAAVLRRMAALRLRRENVRSAHRPESTDITPPADEIVARVEQERELAGQVLALEEPYRSAVLLRYYRGMNAAEIGRELHLPSATVRTHLKRGLERLRTRLDQAAGGDGRSWIAALLPLGPAMRGTASAPTLFGGGVVAKALVAALVVAVAALLITRRPAETPASVESGGALAPIADAAGGEHAPAQPSNSSSPRVELSADSPLLEQDEETGIVVRAVRRDNGQVPEGVRGYLRLDGPGGGYNIRWPEKGQRARLLEQAVPDETGVLRFDLPHGKRLLLHVSCPEREVGWLELPIEALAEGEVREVEAPLPVGPDLRFMGRLVDDVSGAPLPQVQVVIPNGWSSDDVVENYAETRTDADGYFAIDGLSWERQHVQVDAPGYGRLLSILVPGHDSRGTAQELRMLRSASLNVRVAGKGGMPLDVEVRAKTGFSGLIRPSTGRGDTVGFGPRWSTTTGADGLAELAGLPPGVPIELELWIGDELARRVDDAPRLRAGETRDLEFALGAGARLLGEARDAKDSPVAGLEVLLVAAGSEQQTRYFTSWDSDDAAQRTSTDAEGRFLFEDVPPGAWLVGPTYPRSSGEPFDDTQAPSLATILRIDKDEIEKRVALAISSGLSIRGRVVDSTGAPRADLWVRLRSDSLSGVGDWLTGEDGRFVAGPLAPGRYRLVANGRGNCADSEEIEVEAGGDDEVVLTLGPAAEIRGRVVDHETGEGRPAELRLIAAREPDGYERWSKSSREGHFYLESLQPGTYHLLARADDGSIALLRDLEVKAATSLENIEARLEPGAILVVSAPESTESRGFSLRHEGLHAGHGHVDATKTSEQVVFAGVTTVLYRASNTTTGELQVELARGERRQLTLPATREDDD